MLLMNPSVLFFVIIAQCYCAHGCMQVRPPNAAVLRANGAIPRTTRTGEITRKLGDPVGAAKEITNVEEPLGAANILQNDLENSETSTSVEGAEITAYTATDSLESFAKKFAEPKQEKLAARDCEQPPLTSSLFVSDAVDQYNDVSFGPLGGPDSASYEKRCKCGNGTIYYYKSVYTTSWFDILATGNQAVDLTCTAMGKICVCDTMNICYTSTNSTVHAVIASYCNGEGECNLYMLIEGDTDDEGMVPIGGGPVIRSGDQYPQHSTTPYMINNAVYKYKKISAIACGHCPIYRPDC